MYILSLVRMKKKETRKEKEKENKEVKEMRKKKRNTEIIFRTLIHSSTFPL